ncbi:ATP-binding cassette domain-containing protein [Streptomyces sp. DASNCL29]|uniref:ATP-binding cassette domain-containing protein n=1 Tax=Streptomyces sp. DASNCL29 TaxID=2583819 RepID=UPI003211F0EB
MTTPVIPPGSDTRPARATPPRPAHRPPFWVNQRLGLLVLVVGLGALFGVVRPTFLDARLVLFPLVRDVSTLTVVALAQMVVLSLGHMNLAVGRMAAFGALFAGLGYDRLGLPLPLGLLLCLCATAAGHRDIGLDVRPGEIVGLYGLVGAGRSELVKAVLGLDRVTGGEIRVHGEPVRIASPRQALHRFGIGYLTENRKEEGVFLDQPIARNITVTVWRRLAKALGFISAREERDVAHDLVERLGIRIAGLDRHAGELSGGNQQKVSLAKWLAADQQRPRGDDHARGPGGGDGRPPDPRRGGQRPRLRADERPDHPRHPRPRDVGGAPAGGGRVTHMARGVTHVARAPAHVARVRTPRPG